MEKKYIIMFRNSSGTFKYSVPYTAEETAELTKAMKKFGYKYTRDKYLKNREYTIGWCIG